MTKNVAAGIATWLGEKNGSPITKDEIKDFMGERNWLFELAKTKNVTVEAISKEKKWGTCSITGMKLFTRKITIA